MTPESNVQDTPVAADADADYIVGHVTEGRFRGQTIAIVFNAKEGRPLSSNDVHVYLNGKKTPFIRRLQININAGEVAAIKLEMQQVPIS